MSVSSVSNLGHRNRESHTFAVVRYTAVAVELRPYLRHTTRGRCGYSHFGHVTSACVGKIVSVTITITMHLMSCHVIPQSRELDARDSSCTRGSKPTTQIGKPRQLPWIQAFRLPCMCQFVSMMHPRLLVLQDSTWSMDSISMCVPLDILVRASQYPCACLSIYNQMHQFWHVTAK